MCELWVRTVPIAIIKFDWKNLVPMSLFVFNHSTDRLFLRKQKVGVTMRFVHQEPKKCTSLQFIGIVRQTPFYPFAMYSCPRAKVCIQINFERCRDKFWVRQINSEPPYERL